MIKINCGIDNLKKLWSNGEKFIIELWLNNENKFYKKATVKFYSITDI